MSGVVASIGTMHPWNAAGLGLDLRVADSFGVRNLSVTVAVSAQDAKGMHALEAVSPEIVHAQLASLPVKNINALRIGALVGKKNVRAVAKFMCVNPKIPAVVDPVFGATLGGVFLGKSSYAAFRDDLATIPSVILTPNLEEAARLLRVKRIEREDLAQAAKALCGNVQAVLLKGGHLVGDPVDALAVKHADGSVGVELFEDQRIKQTMGGTGCVLAMALACELARGLALRDAVQSARAFVRSRIVASERFAGLNLAY